MNKLSFTTIEVRAHVSLFAEEAVMIYQLFISLLCFINAFREIINYFTSKQDE